jgi:hypothetical protein
MGVLIRCATLGAPPRNASSLSARALQDFCRARCVHDGRSFLCAALLETLLVPWSRCWSGRSLRASTFRSSPSSRCLIHAMHTARAALMRVEPPRSPARRSMRARRWSPARRSSDARPEACEGTRVWLERSALHEASQASTLRGHEKKPTSLAEHGCIGSVFLARFVLWGEASGRPQYRAMSRKHSFRFRCSKQRLTPEPCLAQCRASGTLRPVESLATGPGRVFQQLRSPHRFFREAPGAPRVSS